MSENYARQNQSGKSLVTVSAARTVFFIIFIIKLNQINYLKAII